MNISDELNTFIASISLQRQQKTFEIGGANDLCACISTHTLGESGGMLPQEKFAN